MADKQTETKTETAASAAVEDSLVANFDELKKNYGAPRATDLYHQIANIAGFGSHGKDHIGANNEPSYPVLDYSSASTDAKSAIAKLLKESR